MIYVSDVYASQQAKTMVRWILYIVYKWDLFSRILNAGTHNNGTTDGNNTIDLSIRRTGRPPNKIKGILYKWFTYFYSQHLVYLLLNTN